MQSKLQGGVAKMYHFPLRTRASLKILTRAAMISSAQFALVIKKMGTEIIVEMIPTWYHLLQKRSQERAKLLLYKSKPDENRSELKKGGNRNHIDSLTIYTYL